MVTLVQNDEWRVLHIILVYWGINVVLKLRMIVL